ncbi:hypothetical protein AGMMS49525_13180 [Bacteroidia bacterium]|nr:hypothetical protein AGMMS49525_13180 [Bacteroidia bacterium]
MQEWDLLAYCTKFNTLSFLWSSDIINCWNYISWNKKTIVIMVSYYVVGGSTEDWS